MLLMYLFSHWQVSAKQLVMEAGVLVDDSANLVSRGRVGEAFPSGSTGGIAVF